MDQKLAAIQAAINRLADVSASIHKEVIDESSIVTTKM